VTTTISHKRAVGKAIAYARDLRGITQNNLADQAGISRSTHQRTEGGLRSPSLDELRSIAEVLNVPVSWLSNPPLPPTVETGPYAAVHVLDAHRTAHAHRFDVDPPRRPHGDLAA